MADQRLGLLTRWTQNLLGALQACGWVMGTVAGGHAVGEAVYAALVYSVAEELKIPVWEADGSRGDQEGAV